jgi:leader peptidase (prepilin peptidase)/N-methyltransferase
MNLAAAAELLGAIPVGWASALAARRLAASDRPGPVLMIAVQAAVALSAILLAPPTAVPSLLVAGWVLALLAAVDTLALRLPNIGVLPLGLAGMILGPSLTETPWLDHVIGASVGYVLLALLALAYARLRGRDGLGMGDAKLLGAAGAWLGWAALPSVAVMACGGGLGWAAVRLLRQGRSSLAEPLAFGAPLCASTWLALLLAARGAGPTILTWPG